MAVEMYPLVHNHCANKHQVAPYVVAPRNDKLHGHGHVYVIYLLL